jgi:hypothetical protein
MKLTPEQLQGVLELEPNAQIDRLQGERPYIRTGYWNRQRDLEGLNAGLAKLGLKANEIDDYDEDTGWLYWYELVPISNESSINENESEVEYLMSKFYEYRNLAAEAGANGAKEEAADFNKQAMEYYERAMDLEVANMSNSDLSPEDQAMIDKYEDEEANREVPRDYASMYENKTNNNKMENINLNRWAKLAGINENEKIYRRDPRGNEEWEGSINGLGKEGHPRVFDRMGDIILANYPEEGNSTYRMEVYYNDNNEPTGASGGFAIEKGNVYFDFKFKGDQVVDFDFNEQKY